MAQVTVFDVRYSQNGCPANEGPSIITVYDKSRAERISNLCNHANPDSHAVTSREMDEKAAHDIVE